MTSRQTRRRYLLALGTVGTATVAGCSEGTPETTDSGTDSGETESTRTETGSTRTETESTRTETEPTRTETESTPTESDSGDRPDDTAGPTTTFRRYLEAYASGDRATVESLTHPESGLAIETEDLDLTLSSVERTTLSAIAEAESIELTEAELADARMAIDDEVASIGAEEYVTVSYTAETEQYGEQSGYALVVRDAGQWYVYSMVLRYLFLAQESDSEST